MQFKLFDRGETVGKKRLKRDTFRWLLFSRASPKILPRQHRLHHTDCQQNTWICKYQARLFSPHWGRIHVVTLPSVGQTGDQQAGSDRPKLLLSVTFIRRRYNSIYKPTSTCCRNYSHKPANLPLRHPQKVRRGRRVSSIGGKTRPDNSRLWEFVSFFFNKQLLCKQRPSLCVAGHG